jgi:isoquinoline 1-oxidoreductase subunit alpha
MRISVNRQPFEITSTGDKPLLWVLREDLGLTGTKFSCGKGICGSCTVHLNGKAVRSCVLPVSEAAGAEITTIEGLPEGDPVRKAWIKLDVPQCGYCQPGQIMAATALLKERPSPSDSDIRTYMTNICRCGTYCRIRSAIRLAAGERG